MTQDFLIRQYYTSSSPVEAQFSWVKRSCQLENSEGEIYLSFENLEFPSSWSQLAIDITVSKYFKKKKSKSEKSLKELVQRVSKTLKAESKKQKYLKPKDAEVFYKELKYILYSQRAAFNSPVWFNVGVYPRPQSSACFIQSLEDSLEGIFDLLTRESKVFKYGSGSGTNFSVLRSKYEELESGGKSSGLLSFLEVFDRAAGAIKSGGTTRRAAKMVIVDADHPEIEDFVDLKMKEEKKARVLEKAGYSLGLEGEVTSSLKGQNANNSVRVTDKFMKSVLTNKSWDLRYRTNHKIYKTISALDLWNKIVKSAYECADPGLQFHDNINKWNTCKFDGQITASNPCSEYMFLNDTSCNLASLNLLKFLDENNQFLYEDFKHTIKVIFFAQELLIDLSSYPSKSIEENSKNYRSLGIGFANLGAFLLKLGIPYDSDLARSWAAYLAATLTGVAYEQSILMAKIKKPFSRYAKNKVSMLKVLRQHQKQVKKISFNLLPKEFKLLLETQWKQVVQKAIKHGVRNAQASVIAPTGTIAFFMDCETTGIEPEFSFIRYKKLVSQKTEIKMVSRCFLDALRTLGYEMSEVEKIEKQLLEAGEIKKSFFKTAEHYQVFQTAIGENHLSSEAHLKMMAAVQPFVSGAISKTVNLPQDTTEKELSEVYMKAWQLGLKSIAIYRDQSKVVQPLSLTPVCPECGKQTDLVSGCYVCKNCGTSLSCG